MAEKQGFVEGLADEASKVPGEILGGIYDGVMRALFEPFTSSPPHDPPPHKDDRDSRSGGSGGCNRSWFCRCRCQKQ